MTKQQIGWQKYEDMLEKQMKSPILANLYKSFYDNIYDEAEVRIEDLEDELSEEEIQELLKVASSQTQNEQVMLPVDDKLLESINLVENFDCWMGHTNFNITKEVKKKLNKTDGVEVLKICSRYRFFVGIGKMFDFKEVRLNIEKGILKGD